MNALGLAILALLVGCSSVPDEYKRVWLDSTSHQDDPPEWVTQSRLIWEKDDKLYLRASHTIRGDERVDGCYELARFDAKEAILTELASDLKGSLDNAQQSINENAEIILGKVRTGEYEGRLSGMRHLEEYFERYRIGDTERIDCHVLSEISTKDYAETKKSVVNRLQKADPRIREAITKKQIDFFQKRETASTPEE